MRRKPPGFSREFQVLAGRLAPFRFKPRDYEAFEEIVEETLLARPMRICGFCLMPNHWHLVLWPEHDGELAAFMRRLTITHVTRWQKHRGKVGEGHLYQGRFKSFPVEENDYFYQVMWYVDDVLVTGCARVSRPRTSPRP